MGLIMSARGDCHPEKTLKKWTGEKSLDIYFKEEVTSGSDNYYTSLEVLINSYVNTSEDGGFCGAFGCVEIVIPIVTIFPYGVPYFLIKE